MSAAEIVLGLLIVNSLMFQYLVVSFQSSQLEDHIQDLDVNGT